MTTPIFPYNARWRLIPFTRIARISNALVGAAELLQPYSYRFKSPEQLTYVVIEYLLYSSPLGVVKQAGKQQYTLVSNLRIYQLISDWQLHNDPAECARRRDWLGQIPVLCFTCMDEELEDVLACGELLIQPQLQQLRGNNVAQMKIRWKKANTFSRDRLLGGMTRHRWLRSMFSRSSARQDVRVESARDEQAISEDDRVSWTDTDCQGEEGEDA